MSDLPTSWRFWALLSAGFAAATAILAKVGLSGVGPDVAPFVRTVAFLGERLAPHHWLGVGLIAAGAGLLAWRA